MAGNVNMLHSAPTQLIPKSRETKEPAMSPNPTQSTCLISYTLSPYLVTFNFAKKARTRREVIQKGRLSQKIHRH